MITLNRRDVLRLLGAGGGAFAARYAHAQTAITIQNLTDRISVLSGAGGNITILKSGDGLLMTDAGLPDTVAALLAKLKETSSAPVQQLINTHWHYDHVGANTELAKSGTRILAHVNTAKRLSTAQHMAFFNRDIPALPEGGRPKQTFTSKGKMAFAGEDVHYEYLPPAHTDGDTVIRFAKDDVYTAGDLVFNGMYPFIDYSSGGSIEGMVRNAAMIVKAAGAKTRIVPGHGPVCGKAEVQAFHDMLADANEQISKLIKQGRTADEIVAAAPLKQHDAKWGQGFMKTPDWVKLIHDGKTQARG